MFTDWPGRFGSQGTWAWIHARQNQFRWRRETAPPRVQSMYGNTNTAILLFQLDMLPVFDTHDIIQLIILTSTVYQFVYQLHYGGLHLIMNDTRCFLVNRIQRCSFCNMQIICPNNCFTYCILDHLFFLKYAFILLSYTIYFNYKLFYLSNFFSWGTNMIILHAVK